jgi:hypothetical protein
VTCTRTAFEDHRPDRPRNHRAARRALVVQERLAAETAAAGDPESGYGAEEIGECLLDLGREEEARPYLARAAELLGADAWLADHEPDRIARLRRLGRG